MLTKTRILCQIINKAGILYQKSINNLFSKIPKYISHNLKKIPIFIENIIIVIK